MVVVVQLFARDQDAPGRDIGAGISHLKVTVAPEMGSAVDDAGRHDGRPGHLHRPHGQASRAEQQHVDHQHHAHALPREGGVEMPLEPIVWRAMPEARQSFFVFGFGPVQLCALQQHGFDAVHMGTVRVFGLLAFGMVFAVDRSPLLGHLTGGQPQPEAKEMRGNRMKLKRPVGLVAVQEDCHTDHGDMGHGQREQHDLPPAQLPRSVGQPVNDGVKHCPIS